MIRASASERLHFFSGFGVINVLVFNGFQGKDKG